MVIQNRRQRIKIREPYISDSDLKKARDEILLGKGKINQNITRSDQTEVEGEFRTW